jgi:hypothetical protein
MSAHKLNRIREFFIKRSLKQLIISYATKEMIV